MPPEETLVKMKEEEEETKTGEHIRQHLYQEQSLSGKPSCFHRFPAVGLQRRKRRRDEGGGWRVGPQGEESRM